MDRKRTTGRDIRRQNRSALLSELFFNGPLSRLELAEITGLSPATASNVTAELFAERLIVEAGQVDSDGGRPRVLLRVDPEFGSVIGVAVAETGIRVELFDLGLISRAEVTYPPGPGGLEPGAVADLIAAGVARVLSEAELDDTGLIGIGVAVPGVVAQEVPGTGDGERVHAPTIGWAGVALSRLLRERGLTPSIHVDNGAKTLGQAEMWFGAGRGAGHAVVVLIGTGVGAAVFSDGVAYQGINNSAGEWGHTTIRYDGRVCRCGARGCLEAYIGAEGILGRYREASGDEQIEEVAALLSAAGDSKVAADLLDETADLVGVGIADLINLYNPERVLVGGATALLLGPRMLTRIRESAGRSALSYLFEQVSIELGALGSGAAALGAATLPVAALLALAADPRRAREQPDGGEPG